MDEIEIVEVPNQKVIGIRKIGKYGLIAQLLPSLYHYGVKKGAEFTGPPVFVCHEKSVEEVMKADQEGTADVEIAFPVRDDIEESDEIKCYELPGGTMAKILHKGPYEACSAAYDKLFSWIQQNGKTITGPTREVYLNDPREVGMEEALTEIYAPIK
jgi:effector-binding domain-containing protein